MAETLRCKHCGMPIKRTTDRSPALQKRLKYEHIYGGATNADKDAIAEAHNARDHTKPLKPIEPK